MPEANDRATIGGNRPPLKEFYEEQNAALPGYLDADNADLLERTAELLAAFDRAPGAIDNQELAGKMSDFIAQISKCVKNAEAKRVDIKAGPLSAGRLIDGFFQKNILDKLTPAKTKLLERLTVWERAVAAEEKRRREEAERIARQQAEEAARVEREAAEKARLAEEKIRNEKDLSKAIALKEEQERAAIEAQERQAEAAKAAEAATAKAAELGTVRGDFGSSSSLRTAWVAKILDESVIDLNELRGLISKDAIQKALNAHVKIHKGAKPLRGVKFYEETTAVVRG